MERISESGHWLRVLYSRVRNHPLWQASIFRCCKLWRKIVKLLVALLAITALAAPCFAGPALPPITVSLIMVTWVGPTPVPPDVQTPAMMLVGNFTGPPGDANTVGSAMHQCKQAAETALINVAGPPNAVGVSFQCVQSK